MAQPDPFHTLTVFTTGLLVRPNETMQRVEAVQTSPRCKLRVSVTWF